jgi:hypothetical protein
MVIREINLERKGDRGQCGTLAFRDGARSGHLLFLVQFQRGGQVTVEFVAGLGAHQADISANHDQLVDAVVQAAFEHVSRKTLFL